MEVVLQWLDELDDLVFLGFTLARRPLFLALAACVALIGFNGLYWLMLA